MIGGEPDVVKHLDPIFATLAPGRGDIAAHAGPRKGRRHGRAGLSALRPERRRPFRQDGAQRHRIRRDGGLCRGPGGAQGRQYRQEDRRGRCGNHAAARSRALSVRSQPARHCGALAPRQRDRLLAARPPGRGPDRGSRICRNSPGGYPIPAKAAGRSRPPSTRACRPMCCPRRSTSASARAARRISPTSCSRPCATSSAAISRSQPGHSRQIMEPHQTAATCERRTES